MKKTKRVRRHWLKTARLMLHDTKDRKWVRTAQKLGALTRNKADRYFNFLDDPLPQIFVVVKGAGIGEVWEGPKIVANFGTDIHAAIQFIAHRMLFGEVT